MSTLLVQATEEQVNNVKKELKEDDAKMEHYVKLFYDWLRCEDHLPQDTDRILVENYIRLCKQDLQRAKDKFEKFIIATGRHKNFFDYGQLEATFFKSYQYHRMSITLPRLTPEGYRIHVLQFEDSDVTNFNMETLVKFVLLNGAYTMLSDLNGGVVGIFDLTNIGIQFIQKFDLMVFKNSVEISLNILPTRVRGIHVINLPIFAEVVFALTQKFLKEKVRNRVVLHKNVDGLLDYFDRGLLPKEFGGTLKSLNEIGDDWKEFWIQDNVWVEKIEALKLMGPIPKNKLNGTDDNIIGSSFRQLSID